VYWYWCRIAAQIAVKENAKNKKGDSAIPSNLAGTTAHDGGDLPVRRLSSAGCWAGNFGVKGLVTEKGLLFAGYYFQQKT